MEIRKRGYDGCLTQVKTVVRPWRSEGQERAFVRFETAPGEQAQMDWGHFGNWDGKRLYGFALTLCWSRMQYVEFTQRQDAETLLNCMMHAMTFFGGIPATVLTDNMKTVILDRIDGQPRFHPKMLDFASYYGFLPRVCHPYRPQTKGKIESTIRYIKGSFWPGLSFDSLEELNRLALVWCEEANRRIHATTREVPLLRFPHEGLMPLNGQPAYDTSYVSHRQVAKDCLVAYRGNRYSAACPRRQERRCSRAARLGHDPYLFSAGTNRRTSSVHARGEMVVERSHYASLPRRLRLPRFRADRRIVELTRGPGVGLHYVAPEVEFRPLSIYQLICGEVGHVASV